MRRASYIVGVLLEGILPKDSGTGVGRDPNLGF